MLLRACRRLRSAAHCHAIEDQAKGIRALSACPMESRIDPLLSLRKLQEGQFRFLWHWPPFEAGVAETRGPLTLNLISRMMLLSVRSRFDLHNFAKFTNACLYFPDKSLLRPHFVSPSCGDNSFFASFPCRSKRVSEGLWPGRCLCTCPTFSRISFHVSSLLIRKYQVFAGSTEVKSFGCRMMDYFMASGLVRRGGTDPEQLHRRT